MSNIDKRIEELLDKKEKKEEKKSVYRQYKVNFSPRRRRRRFKPPKKFRDVEAFRKREQEKLSVHEALMTGESKIADLPKKDLRYV